MVDSFMQADPVDNPDNMVNLQAVLSSVNWDNLSVLGCRSEL
jgi:hypothetical protein